MAGFKPRGFKSYEYLKQNVTAPSKTLLDFAPIGPRGTYGMPSAAPTGNLPALRMPQPGPNMKDITPGSYFRSPVSNFGSLAEKEMWYYRKALAKKALQNFMPGLSTGTNIMDLINLGGQAYDYANPAIYTGAGGLEYPFAFTNHWGPYDCGVTPIIKGNTFDGYLDEGTFACLPGQVYAFDMGASYQSGLTIPAGTDMRHGLVIGRWNGSLLAGRFTLIEHWHNSPAPLGVTATDIEMRYVPFYATPVPSFTPTPTPTRITYPNNRTRDIPEYRWPRGGPPTKPYVFDGVPQLPKPREEKWKMPAHWIKDIYGQLTEFKDAIKCAEKSIKGYHPAFKGGLHMRVASLAAHLYYNPNSLPMGTFEDCVTTNWSNDRLIGKMNKLANTITKSPYWVRPVGTGTGSWAGRHPVKVPT